MTDNPRLTTLNKAINELKVLPTRPTYLALSHCWGKDGVPLKTTKETVGKFEQSIPFEDLPRTFREAVIITRKLNVRYLWIDSLCIIQDDSADWEREAAKMADIFRSAHITLAASSAEGCHDGCFESQPATPASRFYLPNNTDNVCGGVIYVQDVFQQETSHITVLNQSPMHKRGWILQKTLLSRRILHLTKGQFYWQCNSLLESEDQILSHTCEADLSRLLGEGERPSKYWRQKNILLSNTPLSSFRPGSNPNDQAHRWWSLMEEYSSRSLTFPEDFLPALAGLVALYQRLMGDESVVGLWKNNLAIHLSWRQGYFLNWSAKEVDDQQPSWSWTKIVPFWRDPPNKFQTSGKLHFPEYEHMPFGNDGFQVIWKADIQDVEVSWEGLPIVSKLSRAELKVASIGWPNREVDKFMWSVIVPRAQCTLSRRKHHSYFDLEKHRNLYAKGGLESLHAIEILLWIGFDHTGDKWGSYFRHCSMLLVPKDDSQQSCVYRRIGIAEGEWACTQDDRAEAEKFVLSRLQGFDTILRLI
jgi:hypothetical protein